MSNNDLDELWYVLDAAYRAGSESSNDIGLALGRLPSDYDDVVTECQSLAIRIGQSRSDVVNDLKEKSAKLATLGQQFEAVAKALEHDAPEFAVAFAPGLREAGTETVKTVELLNAKVKVADEALAAAVKALEAAGTAMTGQTETVFKPASDSLPKIDDLLEQLAVKRDEVHQALERQQAADS